MDDVNLEDEYAKVFIKDNLEFLASLEALLDRGYVIPIQDIERISECYFENIGGDYEMSEGFEVDNHPFVRYVKIIKRVIGDETYYVDFKTASAMMFLPRLDLFDRRTTAAEYERTVIKELAPLDHFVISYYNKDTLHLRQGVVFNFGGYDNNIGDAKLGAINILKCGGKLEDSLLELNERAGTNQLHDGCFVENFPESVPYFVSQMPDGFLNWPNFLNHDTPLMSRVRSASLVALELINAGADITLLDVDGKDALQIARELRGNPYAQLGDDQRANLDTILMALEKKAQELQVSNLDSQNPQNAEVVASSDAAGVTIKVTEGSDPDTIANIMAGLKDILARGTPVVVEVIPSELKKA